MAFVGRQILGLILAIIGVLGTIMTCGLPLWKVTTVNGDTFQIIFEGLWVKCVTQSTGQMQCKAYDSLALPEDLQAARALFVIAIIVMVFGFVLAFLGSKCINFVKEEKKKRKVIIASGVLFIIAGLLVLIPVSWTAISTERNILHKIWGASLYIGWGSAGMLFLGGVLLCSSCPPSDENDYDVRYTEAHSVVTIKTYITD